jgi:hypothetical protein
MLNKLIRLFKNKNKMSFDNKSLEEIEVELKNSNFQWIKGENLGMIEKFAEVSQEGDLKFVNFQGGGRMNLAIITEFMDIFPAIPIQFHSDPELLQSESSSHTKGKVNSVNYGEPVVGIEESPIYKLLKKQKPNWVNVNISLKLNLPKKSLYDVLISSFDDAENEIANYIVEGVEIEDIKEAIAESIRTSFYDSKKSTNKQIKKTEEDEISED